MTITKILMLVACISHLATMECDRLITYTPNGRFGFPALKDNEQLSKLFDGTPLKRAMISMVLGVYSLAVSFFGYLALVELLREYSVVYAVLMLIGAVLFFLPGVAHHVFFGAIEWFYIRSGRTEESRKMIMEFFRKTSSTMYVCYFGLLLFSVSLFIPVVSGITPLPQWACVFNILPLFIVLAPIRIVGTGNLASALMFLGLFIFI